MLNRKIWVGLILLLMVATMAPVAADDDDEMDDGHEMDGMTPKELLGMQIFFDTRLSEPQGQSCANCHDPEFGFSEPDTDRAVSQGSTAEKFGNRNSPSAAYAGFSPEPSWVDGTYSGGQFWDGRAPNLTEQAKGPFLNELEMSSDKETVVKKIKKSGYSDLFKEVYGNNAFSDVDMAYHNAADAIAAFEMTDKVNRFNSKYDRSLEGEVDLTPEEEWGLELFNDPLKGNCAACHPSAPGPYSDKPLFTDYTYDNLGVPSNLGMYGDYSFLKYYYPFYYLALEFNPDGLDFVDLGLGGFFNDMDYDGMVKVPTLRNVEKTGPYMHNGVFETLDEVVQFYNTRDSMPFDWPDAEVSDNVNTEELGNLALTPAEEKAIVAFMKTLTDEPYNFENPHDDDDDDHDDDDHDDDDHDD